MFDYKTEHRCLLCEVAAGRERVYTRPNRTVQALILAGFLASETTYDSAGQRLTVVELTPAGHRYLGGLWY
ncbi:hypothetical protein [Pseudomonas sp. NPDC007930]|uniref:hypothetical protein n=1 Tax=Pseudomonas sp. NPDC007930 TaxID=3364417 RepID=UPI0036E64B6B